MPDLEIRDLNKDGGLRRYGRVRVISADDRTVELSFSSEAPVERWFGEEVLSHDAGAIRMDRLTSGAALLVNHDWDDQVGVVDSVEFGSDRRGRAVVRFGRGARAEEIFRDVQDGIRKHVSVGYLVHKVEVETRKGAPDLVRVIDWEPYEISIVAVPADPTIGIGRGLAVDVIKSKAMEGQMADENTTTPAPQAAAPAAPAQAVNTDAIRAAATDAERARVRAITETAAKFEAPAEFVRSHLDAGSTVEQFNAAMLERMNQNRAKPLTEGKANIGLTDKEVRSYSFMRLFRALANPTDTALKNAAAFEFECAVAASERSHRAPKGVLVPGDVLTRAINTGTSGSAAGDTGGYLVATELMSQSFVDMLRNRAVAMQLGTPMGGLVGNVDIPAQASGATGYWIGEDAETTLSALEFGQFSLAPKTVAGMSEITRRMLMQSSLDVEALVRRDLAATLALAIDLSAFYGTGSSNQPRGIANVAGINAVDFGTDGAGAGTGQLPSYADVVAMETEIAADNADIGSMAYVLNARMRGHLKTTEKFSGTSGAPIWEPGNTVNGYRTGVTNQIANGDVIFGNFADLLIGMWGGLDITVDPYTHSQRGRIRIVMMQDVDIAVRRAASFCLGRDATA